MNDPIQSVDKQHRYFNRGTTKDVSFRIDQLKKLKKLLKEHEDDILKAMDQDFKKPAFETYGTEVGILYSEIDYILKHLKKWAKPERVWGSLINFPSRNYIYRHPYGVSLVIGAWNYPILLTLSPALGSMAAGNCTLIKPSEIAPHSSHLLAEIINRNFDEGYLKVIEGDAGTTQQLLSQPLDYIFFTGSNRVGKIIMKAAAEQLTPVTLELGGKSPAIVDNNANLAVAAKRIAWGKFLNAGQTCVAPDYLYVHQDVKKSFLNKLTQEITNLYGSDPQESPDYPRIINQDHFHRLKRLFDSENGTLVTGGRTDEQERYIEPTILENISWEDEIMQEEIFGPILPVLEFRDLNTVIHEMRNRPAPLALYLFSEQPKIHKKIIREIPFGGGCINDTIVHLGSHNLPFGGVGQSGFGSYHGKRSFQTFSYEKSILKKATWFDNPVRYAPYSGKLKWLKKFLG